MLQPRIQMTVDGGKGCHWCRLFFFDQGPHQIELSTFSNHTSTAYLGAMLLFELLRAGDGVHFRQDKEHEQVQDNNVREQKQT